MRPAGDLSPGERTRALLAVLSARPVTCLVLDEPTNHLDLEAIEQLEGALDDYAGALLLVTHDRRMLERVLKHILVRGWAVAEPSGELTAPPDPMGWLEFLAAQIQPVLEAYRALFQVVDAYQGAEVRKQILEETGSVLKDHLLIGEAHFPESESPVTFQNALALLLREDVLRCEENPLRPDARFEPGPRWEQLEGLRQRVAGALVSR